MSQQQVEISTPPVPERSTAQLVRCPMEDCKVLMELHSDEWEHVPVGAEFLCGGCGTLLQLDADGRASERWT